VIPIDYPGFNLRAARHAHALGIPVLYYIAPQVWAWRAGRIRTLIEVARHVAVILPFEVEVLRDAGDRVSFVGHPLLERPDDVADDAAFRARWSLPAGRPILALLPGSRVQEVERHLEAFTGAARILTAASPDLLPVVARAPTVPVRCYGDVDHPMVDDSRALLRHARAAVVKSGPSALAAA